MTKTSELNPKRNEHHHNWIKFNRESVLVILVVICAILSAGTHFRMNAVVDDVANQTADVDAGYKVNISNMILSNQTLTKEVRILQNKIDRYEADLHAGE